MQAGFAFDKIALPPKITDELVPHALKCITTICEAQYRFYNWQDLVRDSTIPDLVARAPYLRG